VLITVAVDAGREEKVVGLRVCVPGRRAVTAAPLPVQAASAPLAATTLAALMKLRLVIWLIHPPHTKLSASSIICMIIFYRAISDPFYHNKKISTFNIARC
jgi:hypothetical protein